MFKQSEAKQASDETMKNQVLKSPSAGKVYVILARATISPPNVVTKIPWVIASKTPVRFTLL